MNSLWRKWTWSKALEGNYDVKQLKKSNSKKQQGRKYLLINITVDMSAYEILVCQKDL